MKHMFEEPFMRRLAKAVSCIVLLAGLSSPLSGLDYVWTGLGGDNNWTTDGNWDQTGFPATGDTATIDSVTAQTPNLNANITVDAFTLTADSLTAPGAVYLRCDGDATINAPIDPAIRLIMRGGVTDPSTLTASATIGKLEIGETSGPAATIDLGSDITVAHYIEIIDGILAGGSRQITTGGKWIRTGLQRDI